MEKGIKGEQLIGFGEGNIRYSGYGAKDRSIMSSRIAFMPAVESIESSSSSFSSSSILEEVYESKMKDTEFADMNKSAINQHRVNSSPVIIQKSKEMKLNYKNKINNHVRNGNGKSTQSTKTTTASGLSITSSLSSSSIPQKRSPRVIVKFDGSKGPLNGKNNLIYCLESGLILCDPIKSIDEISDIDMVREALFNIKNLNGSSSDEINEWIKNRKKIDKENIHIILLAAIGKEAILKVSDDRYVLNKKNESLLLRKFIINKNVADKSKYGIGKRIKYEKPATHECLPIGSYEMNQLLDICDFCFLFANVLNINRYGLDTIYNGLTSHENNDEISAIHMAFLKLLSKSNEQKNKKDNEAIDEDLQKIGSPGPRELFTTRRYDLLINNRSWQEVLRLYFLELILDCNKKENSITDKVTNKLFVIGTIQLYYRDYKDISFECKLAFLRVLIDESLCLNPIISSIDQKGYVNAKITKLKNKGWTNDVAERKNAKVKGEKEEKKTKSTSKEKGKSVTANIIGDTKIENDDMVIEDMHNEDISLIESPSVRKSFRIRKENANFRNMIADFCEAQMRTRNKPWGTDKEGNDYYTFFSDRSRLYVVPCQNSSVSEKSKQFPKWRCYTSEIELRLLLLNLDISNEKESQLYTNMKKYYNFIAGGLRVRNSDSELDEPDDSDLDVDDDTIYKPYHDWMRKSIEKRVRSRNSADLQISAIGSKHFYDDFQYIQANANIMNNSNQNPGDMNSLHDAESQNESMKSFCFMDEIMQLYKDMKEKFQDKISKIDINFEDGCDDKTENTNLEKIKSLMMMLENIANSLLQGKDAIELTTNVEFEMSNDDFLFGKQFLKMINWKTIENINSILNHKMIFWAADQQDAIRGTITAAKFIDDTDKIHIELETPRIQTQAAKVTTYDLSQEVILNGIKDNIGYNSLRCATIQKLVENPMKTPGEGGLWHGDDGSGRRKLWLFYLCYSQTESALVFLFLILQQQWFGFFPNYMQSNQVNMKGKRERPFLSSTEAELKKAKVSPDARNKQ